jgi:hypothetical protein
MPDLRRFAQTSLDAWHIPRIDLYASQRSFSIVVYAASY